MRAILLCLIVAAPLAGCIDPKTATFSCEPEVSSQRIDSDLYKRPATKAGTGYEHC